MYIGQYALPTEPCDHIYRTERIYYSASSQSCQYLFSDFSVFTGNFGRGVWMSGALERRRKLLRRSEAALGLQRWALAVGCAAIAAGDFAGRPCGGGAFML